LVHDQIVFQDIETYTIVDGMGLLWKSRILVFNFNHYSTVDYKKNPLFPTGMGNI